MSPANLPLDKVHITGGPGSGKTTLARRIASILDVPVYDLDGMALAADPAYLDPVDAVARRLPDVLAGGRWVSEGAYMGWALPLFESAGVIVWMDVPWRVASYRILARHLKAELARNNRFPGWRRLWSFWRWSAGYYGDRNPHRLNAYGVPHTRALAAELLQPYADKLFVCRTREDIERLLLSLTERGSAQD